MVALVGFLMIIAIVVLLLKGKMSPIVVLAVVPAVAALILGYDPVTIADFIREGVKTTTNNGILFIFSVIYFGVLSDTGLFDVIVNWLVKKAGNNVIAITVATALVATISHLDGTTATTVLITIPSLYPIYKKMNIDPKILLCITGACMGVMNLLPWGGPTARAATVLQMDANELWHMLIPIQVVGFIINIALGVLLGMLAVKQGAGAGKGEEVETDEKAAAEANALRKSVPFLVFNLVLTVAVIAILSMGLATSYFVIIAGVLILINRQRIRSEAQEKEIIYLQEINQGMEAVAKQNDELRHYQRIESLGMMASHIAHEFNNYLTPVMVYAELMETDPQLSEENRNMVKEIMNSTERAADLSRQLLDFSRQDSGAKLQKMNLRTETEEAVSIVRQLAPAAVTVNTGIMSEDIEVSGRDGMMQHILMNLCKNAFHAMEDSEKKQLDIVLRKAEGGAELQVRDTGSGISRDALERIFEPFYTTKGSRQGTGLGLSVIRNIMHSIGGTIHVDSTPGEGTCFTLYFPEVHPGKKTADLRNIVIADHDRDYLRNVN
ncbi:MAG: hypothetical protein E7190_14430 [Erysipelotrichaceae bacterium]|nr:hypothetical protein [Erysipelotrichaceae bacterium]